MHALKNFILFIINFTQIIYIETKDSTTCGLFGLRTINAILFSSYSFCATCNIKFEK